MTGAGCLSLSRGTQRPDMRTTGTRVTRSSCRAWMPFNAPFEGVSSLQPREKKKRENKTQPASVAPSPASPAQRPAEAPRCPLPGPGQEAQHALPLSSASPAGHPLRRAWCCSKLTGPDAAVGYLVVKVCLISSRLSLPVTGLCFYEGSFFSWRTRCSLRRRLGVGVVGATVFSL